MLSLGSYFIQSREYLRQHHIEDLKAAVHVEKTLLVLISQQWRKIGREIVEIFSKSCSNQLMI